MPFTGHLVEMPHTLSHQVPGRHIAGVAHDRQARFALEKLRLDRRDHTLGNFVLNGEHVGHREIVAFGPQMGAIAGIDQLRRDAQPLAEWRTLPCSA